MRDLYKLVLLVPVVVILAVFLFRMAPGDVDITAGQGIEVQHQGEDFVISTSGVQDAVVKFHHHLESVAAADVNIIEGTGATAAGISIDLEQMTPAGTPTAQYEIGVDLGALRAALGSDSLDITAPDGADEDTDRDEVTDITALDVHVRPGLTASLASPNAGDADLTFGVNGGEIVGLIDTELGSSDWQTSPATDLSLANRTGVSLDIASSTGSGATVTSATSTMAGLQSAADKLKLDQIESNATADQTGSEIVTALDSELGSTDWQGRKLKVASRTLSATDVANLDTTRIQLIASPAHGSYILPHYMVIIKAGGNSSALPSSPSTAWQNTQIHLSLASSTGGLVEGNAGGPDCVYGRWLHNGTSPGWFNANDYQLAVNLIPTPGSSSASCGRGGGAIRSIYAGSPLSVVGFASDDDNGTQGDTSDDRTAAQVWDANTANLGNLSIRIIVHYETIAP